MKDKFDYYDIFAIVLPGLVGSAFTGLLLSNSPGEFAKDCSSITLGSSVFLCALFYIVGDFLQILGKLFEFIFWFIFGGKPSSWIAETQANWYYRFVRQSSFISKQQIRYIKKLLEIESDLKETDIEENFQRIKAKAFKIENTQKQATILLAKANMHRGFATLFIGVLALQFFFPLLNVPFLVAAGVFVLVSGFKFRQHSIKYTQIVFAGCVEAIEKDTPKRPSTPPRAIGVVES